MTYNNQALITGTGIAQSSLDEAMGKAFDEKVIGKTVTSADSLTAVGSLGPETGETSVSKYDDVDDYNGYTYRDSADVFGTFTVTMSVYYIRDMQPGVTSSIRTFSKEITARLTNKYFADTIKLSVVKSY